MEYRTRGLILCQFPQDEFDSIYWYDNTNVSEAEPTLTYDGKEKNGDGYFSGEFDIHDNGTLIINNVSLLHEKNFKVVWFLLSELFNTYHIEVEVTGKDNFNCNFNVEYFFNSVVGVNERPL